MKRQTLSAANIISSCVHKPNGDNEEVGERKQKVSDITNSNRAGLKVFRNKNQKARLEFTKKYRDE